jgi:hypothetical protein
VLGLCREGPGLLQILLQCKTPQRDAGRDAHGRKVMRSKEGYTGCALPVAGLERSIG